MAKKAKKASTIKVRQVKSAIGYNRRQREVLTSIGLRRIGHVVEREDSPAVRGMVAKVSHLVEVVEEAS